MKLTEFELYKNTTGAKHFSIEELVNPSLLKYYGDRAIYLLNPAAVAGLCEIRHWAGIPMTVNNWHVGGSYKNSGVRPHNTNVGARRSPHKLGLAFDVKVEDPQRLWDNLVAQSKYVAFLSGLMRMEDFAYTQGNNTPWIHLDWVGYGGRNFYDLDIKIFKP